MHRCIIVSDVNSDPAEEPLHNACDVLKIAFYMSLKGFALV